MKIHKTLEARKCTFVTKADNEIHTGIELWNRGIDAVCIDDFGVFYSNREMYRRSYLSTERDWSLTVIKKINL
jgi:hypothetical protein